MWSIATGGMLGPLPLGWGHALVFVKFMFILFGVATAETKWACKFAVNSKEEFR